MSFDIEMFRNAAAKTTKMATRDKWRPEEEGDYLCEVVAYKESWGKNGNFFIPELKVLMAPEGLQECEGREFALFVDMSNQDVIKRGKDYSRIKEYFAAAIGLRGDEESADEEITDARELYLSEIAKLVPVKGGKFEKKTTEYPGAAKGSIIGIRVKHNAAKPDDKGAYRPNQLDEKGEPKIFVNHYPFLVELAEGFTVDVENPSFAIGPDGAKVSRLSVIA